LRIASSLYSLRQYITLHQVNSSLAAQPRCHDIAAGWYASSLRDTAENMVQKTHHLGLETMVPGQS